MAGSVGQLETWMKLVIVLIHIRRSESETKWRPFLEKLDSGGYFRKHPLLWSQGDLDQLEGSQMLAKLSAYREYLESMWDQMQEFVFPALGMESQTKEDFF